MYGPSTLVYNAGGVESIDEGFALRREAARDFWRLVARSYWHRLRTLLGRRPDHLVSLSEVMSGMTLESARQLGATTVPLDKIRGSEGKSADFDSHFRPLKPFNRDRWIGIALARLQGKALPPVELIRVGNAYFVRDGHHRISVARSYGQVDIDAVVTIWNVTAAV